MVCLHLRVSRTMLRDSETGKIHAVAISATSKAGKQLMQPWPFTRSLERSLLLPCAKFRRQTSTLNLEKLPRGCKPPVYPLAGGASVTADPRVCLQTRAS
jgi:hypothetical protein